MFMRRARLLLSVPLMLVGASVDAEVSSTVTLTSDYDFRGLTQTDEDPALQVSLDYVADDGWYVGAWTSNVDFPGYDGSLELDLYTGFAGELDSGLGWDVGLTWYTYPGSDNTATEDELESAPEIYGLVSLGMFSAAVWYSNDYAGSGENAMYVEGGVRVPLPRELSLDLHAGYSFSDYWDDVEGDKYSDYSVGLQYSIESLDLQLRYVDTDRDEDDDRVIFSVVTTFPWNR
jgi:uncharacterized protein (TIGR02001 family)